MAARLIELIRRLCPSNALLSYNPIFKVVGNAVSNILGTPFSEFRKLPPNHLRVRVGVGTQLLNSHAHHLGIGSQFWLECFAKAYVNAEADIVEIGCGCGRIAMHLNADYFSGTYLGIDIDPEMIDIVGLISLHHDSVLDYLRTRAPPIVPQTVRSKRQMSSR